ncbi:uncharacterized protein RJT21DRAFT_140795 [Scheffersomyces amazonensis]|uniref:uncharacterized protein n=1 Tax=Scheffersomyces amazonensis TaxID=1078765 RepID=UPI00315D5FE9
MFSKLKTFSEDMAKSFNDMNLNEAGTGPERRPNPITELKNESKVLATQTPDASELTQPEDEPVIESKSPTPVAKKSVGTDPVHNKEVEKSDKPESVRSETSAEPEKSPEPQTPQKVLEPPKAVEPLKVELPPTVVSKLKKFVKYEEKYPILLQAYKTEKRKGELIILFERVLKEHTPVSSISDAGALVEYLNGLNEKNNMLNAEMRRYAKENTELTKSNISLSEKLDKSNTDLERVNAAQAELTLKLKEKEVQDTEADNEEIEKLKDQLNSTVKENEEFKHKITDLETKLDENVKQIEQFKSQAEDHNSLVEKLNVELEAAKSAVDVQALQKEIEVLKDSVNEKEKEISSIKSVETKREVVHSPANNGSKGKKKKSKKKKNGTQEPEPENEPENETVEDAEIEKLKSSLETLESENKTLIEENRKIKQDLRLQIEEVEELRDSLKNIGDDLVQSRDEVKSLKQSTPTLIDDNQALKEKSLLIDNLSKDKDSLEKQLNDISDKLDKALQEHESKSKEYVAEIESLKKSESNLNESIDIVRQNLRKAEDTITSLEKSITVLRSEKEGLNTRITELSKYKSSDTSLKLEINTLRTTLIHKDKQIEDLKQKVNDVTSQRDQLNQTATKLKATNADLQHSSKILVAEKNQLLTKQELSIEKTRALSAELQKLQTEKHKAVTELERLRSKHDSIVKEAASSNSDYLSFKQQYDELSMKTKESSIRIESLEDDLSEARNLLQERTREASTIRRLLVDAEEQVRLKESEHKSEIKRIQEELLDEQTNIQSQLKRKQREIDELKSITDSYLSKIQDLEKNLNESKEKNNELENSFSQESSQAVVDPDNSFEDTQQTIQTLRQSLQLSAKKVREYENVNGVLKKLNEESNLKFERLSKNYKIITQQYRQMKSSQGSPASSNGHSTDSLPVRTPRQSLDDSGEQKETNTAYLKNVLLGFFEHKEQRDMLLPVVKTIFNFSDDDERKFLLALK